MRIALKERPRQGAGGVHVAIGERRDKGALNQFGIARVGAQGLAEEGRGRESVMFGFGDPRGKIIAGRAVADLERLGNRGGLRSPAPERGSQREGKG